MLHHQDEAEMILRNEKWVVIDTSVSSRTGPRLYMGSRLDP
jgi:hypothetical protein